MQGKGQEREYRRYITAFFARWARLYDPFTSLFRLNRFRREAVKMSGAKGTDRVLDVCTGTGEMAMSFAERCKDVTGIDISDAMLKIANKKGERKSVRFLRMDADRLAFPDKAFDVSSISFGLHEMPPQIREAVLREMARVTKRRVIIIDYNQPRRPVLRALYARAISIYESRYFSEFFKSDLEQLLARNGLQLEEVKTVMLGIMQICVCRPVA